MTRKMTTLQEPFSDPTWRNIHILHFGKGYLNIILMQLMLKILFYYKIFFYESAHSVYFEHTIQPQKHNL